MASNSMLVLRLILAAAVVVLLSKMILIDSRVVTPSGTNRTRSTRPADNPGPDSSLDTNVNVVPLRPLPVPETTAMPPAPSNIPESPSWSESGHNAWPEDTDKTNLATPQQLAVQQESSDSGSSEVPPAPAQPSNAVDHPHQVPIAKDLDWHRSNTHCWEHFDLGFLDEWEKRKETFCTPAGAMGTTLTCREVVDKHLPGPTAPHTNCDATNIGINFELLRPAKCQKHRPGYNCKGDAYWYSYPQGALTGACTRVDRAFTLSRFPRDHLRDIFDSWKSVSNAQSLPETVYPAKYTLLITRERNEHANLFHAMTDMINAYQSLHMIGVLDARREGHRAGIEDVAVILLDEQPTGPFDAVFQKVFSPNFPVRRVHDMKKEFRSVTFQHALFVHPGYTNMLFVQLFERGSCEKSLQLLQSFRMFFLDGFDIDTPMRASADPVRVTFISRKPYTKFVEHHFMGRQVTNEPELLREINKLQDVEAQLVDFAQISFTEQLQLMVNTDILIGMHGAALTHALFLPPWAGVLEMWPKTRDMWRCFEHWSQLAGHAYRRFENSNPGNFHKDNAGDYTRIEPAPFMDHVKQLVEHVVRERQELQG